MFINLQNVIDKEKTRQNLTVKLLNDRLKVKRQELTNIKNEIRRHKFFGQKARDL